MIEDNRKAIHEAVKTDLGGGGFSVDMSDVSGVNAGLAPRMCCRALRDHITAVA